MKRKLVFLLAICMVFSLMGCGRSGEADVAKVKGTPCEIALIMKEDSVEEDPYGQGIWNGIETFAQSNGVTCQWFSVGSDDIEDCKETMNQAISEGARVLVVGGSDFEQAVFSMELEYLDVSFIIVDGPDMAENSDAEAMLHDNITGVAFKEEEAGYMAGYAAVMEGYRTLGFLGGKELPSVIRFGYGFVQGADAAARKLNVDQIDLKYHYLGHFQPGEDVAELAKSWYDGGVEVIFACCGSAGQSVMEAAELSGGKVIGVDSDQSDQSETVVTSATKNLPKAIETILTEYYDGQFPGSQLIRLGVAEGGVALAMDNARLTEFSKAEYEELCRQFSASVSETSPQNGLAPASPGPDILTEEIAIVNEIPTKAVRVSLVQ
ncbi:MAG: BMP family protein [Firmicutes bacterium]|nr:BMP family protein [Bacillota bacterium]